MYRKSLSIVTLMVFVVLSTAATLRASDHQAMTDQEIQAKIEHDLLDKDIVNVTVGVTNGNVTLAGHVSDVWDKEEAAGIAEKMRDVKSVSNQIEIRTDVSDEQIMEEVQGRVNRYVFYTIYDIIQAGVHDGIVTLQGEVTAPYKAQELGRMTAKLTGVRQVVNHIQVLPNSMSDERLRSEIATRIYNNSLFSDLALQSHPPIHIVVDNGQVTLYGYVRSKVDARVAVSIARDTFGVFSVKNDLQTEG